MPRRVILDLTITNAHIAAGSRSAGSHRGIWFSMPGTRSRSRGPWLGRLAAVVILAVLAVGGAAGYMTVAAHHHAARKTAGLPARVVSAQNVGLAAHGTGGGAAGQLVQLLGQSGVPQFTPVPQAEQQAGTAQWTADLMAGNAYIFIFVPDGLCLTETGTPGRLALSLQHCNLQASQRWRRAGPPQESLGHDFYQYASLASGACVTDTGALRGSAQGAGVTPCASADPAQLIAFWWQSESA